MRILASILTTSSYKYLLKTTAVLDQDTFSKEVIKVHASKAAVLLVVVKKQERGGGGGGKVKF